MKALKCLVLGLLVFYVANAFPVYADSVDELIKKLKSENLFTRGEAAEALGKLGDSHAVGPLIAALKDEKDEYGIVQSEAARALGKLGDSRAVEPLIAALRDKNRFLRRAAAEALGEIGDSRAVGPLIAALKDKDLAVQWEAKTLDEIHRVEPRITARDLSFQWGATEALGKIGTPAVGPLIAALQDRDRAVRGGAIEALGKIGTPAVEPLITALRDKDLAVRGGAAETLGKIGDIRAVEPLIAALKDGDIREGAAEALGEIGASRAVGPLIAALQDGDIRERAVKALGKIGTPAVEPLIAALQDKDLAVREGAAEALGKIEGIRAVEPIIAALGGEVKTKELCGLQVPEVAIPEEILRLGNTNAAIGQIVVISKESLEKKWAALLYLINLIGNREVLVARYGYGGDTITVSPGQTLSGIVGFIPIGDKALLALEEITGKKFGENREAWCQWWRTTYWMDTARQE